MQAALAKVDGVEKVWVDCATQTVTVRTDGDVDSRELITAFEGTQYTAKLK